uniref:Cilia- and flagella-associated protein 126 n=1 Tax=Arion vulgaris TaxID=1028688 RepID=A0A0B7BHL5_9EUPU
MSINFHANQYEQAFTPHRLQNWEVPKSEEGKHPNRHTGFTRVKANDRGHLLPNIPRVRSSPWGKYVGTWDMPKNIPGNQVLNPTARSDEALLKNKKIKEESDVILSGALKKCHTVDPLPVKMDTLEEMQSTGVTCEPEGIVHGHQANGMPCAQGKTVCNDTSQSRDSPKMDCNGCLKWPKAKSPACRSPVEYASLPKPMHTMYSSSPTSQGQQECLPIAHQN